MSEINCHGDELSYGQPVPGHTLVKLIYSDKGFPYEIYGNTLLEEGWGLGFGDPIYLFDTDPVPDYLPRPNYNFIPDSITDPLDKIQQHYEDRISINDYRSILHLYDAAKQVGYTGNGGLGHWLCDYLYYYLLKIDKKPSYVSLKKENVCGDIDYWVDCNTILDYATSYNNKHKVIYRNNKFIYLYNLIEEVQIDYFYKEIDEYLQSIDKNYNQGD